MTNHDAGIKNGKLNLIDPGIAKCSQLEKFSHRVIGKLMHHVCVCDLRRNASETTTLFFKIPAVYKQTHSKNYKLEEQWITGIPCSLVETKHRRDTFTWNRIVSKPL